jgi:hypothetical protein
MKILRAVANGLKGNSCPPVIVAATLIAIAGCAGNGQGLDANGRPIDESTVDIALSADFQSIQDNIFTPICSVCHVGAGAPMGLRLDAANSYSLLVGVPSTEVPTILRVKPGDPDNSYIIQKLEGHAAVGARMPFGGPYLSTDTIAFIREWITEGAAQSSTTTPPAAKFGLVSVVPDSSEPLSQSPPQIAMVFNHELDASQIDPRSARIEKLDPITGSVLRIVPASVSIPSGNAKTLMVWPSQPLSVGHYQALLRSALPAGVADMAGQTAPVGRTNADGEFVVSTFDVEVLP